MPKRAGSRGGTRGYEPIVTTEPESPDSEARVALPTHRGAVLAEESIETVDGIRLTYAQMVSALAKATDRLTNFETTAYRAAEARLATNDRVTTLPAAYRQALYEAYQRVTVQDADYDTKRETEHGSWWATRRLEIQAARALRPPVMETPPAKEDRAMVVDRQASWCSAATRVAATRRMLREQADQWIAGNAQCVRAVFGHPHLFPADKLALYQDVADWVDQCGPSPDAVNGLILWGPKGTGKTMLAVSALLSLAAQGYRMYNFAWEGWNTVTSGFRTQGDYCPAYFYDATDLMDRLTPFEKLGEDEASWFDHLRDDVSALVLDEIGIKSMTPHREEILKRHVEWSARGRVLILTTNVPRAQWTTYFDERIADRFREGRRFHVVHVGGASLRQGGR